MKLSATLFLLILASCVTFGPYEGGEDSVLVIRVEKTGDLDAAAFHNFTLEFSDGEWDQNLNAKTMTLLIRRNFKEGTKITGLSSYPDGRTTGTKWSSAYNWTLGLAPGELKVFDRKLVALFRKKEGRAGYSVVWMWEPLTDEDKLAVETDLTNKEGLATWKMGFVSTGRK